MNRYGRSACCFYQFSYSLPQVLFLPKQGWLDHAWGLQPRRWKKLVSGGGFSAIVWGLLQVWFKHPLAWLYHDASGILLRSSLWVDNTGITVFPLELLMFPEAFPGMAVSGLFPAVLSLEVSCFSNKPINYSHMTARDISTIQWVSSTDCMENNWGNRVSGQGESNLGLQHNQLSISQLSWWTEGHPTR